MQNITYLAKTNFRNQNQIFGIKQDDRLLHTFVLGKTGTGKTTLLKNMFLQDMWNHQGCAFLDPHGDVVREIVDKTKREATENSSHKLIYLDCTDPNLKIGFNPLKNVPTHKRPLVASGLLEIFEKLFGKKSWGAKMEHILRNVLLTLLDQDQADLRDINRLLINKSFQEACLDKITNEEVRKFWTEEYFKYPYPSKLVAIAPIQNKVGAFLSNPVCKRVLVDYEVDLDFRHIIDHQSVLLVNLSKGMIGEDASSLLGAIIFHSVGLAAFSRADIPEYKRQSFWLYADEFQNFSTLSIVNMLSELRKFKLGVILANQYLSQLETDIRDAVLGNVGTIISFRLGVVDARYMAKEFHGKFDFDDIARLPNHRIYLKLMIDGTPSKPFSANTLKK